MARYILSAPPPAPPFAPTGDPVTAEWCREFVRKCFDGHLRLMATGADGEEDYKSARESLITEFAAELLAMFAGGTGYGWRPIETAPRGECVLLLRRNGERLIRDWGEFDKYNHPQFTHWQPLPAIPSNTNAKEGA